MDKAMTVRFDEDRISEIEELKNIDSYDLPKSNILRICVAFTNQCVKQLKKNRSDDFFDLSVELDKKFNTNVDSLNLKYF